MSLFVLVGIAYGTAAAGDIIQLPYYESQKTCLIAASQLKKDLNLDFVSCIPADSAKVTIIQRLT